MVRCCASLPDASPTTPTDARIPVGEGVRRALIDALTVAIDEPPLEVGLEVSSEHRALFLSGVLPTRASRVGAGVLCCLSSIRNPDNVLHYQLATDQPMTWFSMMPEEYRSCDEVAIRRLVPEPFLSLFAIDIPAISAESYATRLIERISCPPETFLCAISLCFRATLRDGVGDGIRTDGHRVPFCLRSLHRILLASVVAAAKHRGDVYYTMSYYAEAGGVSRDELVSMESAFIQLLDYNLHIRTSEYVDTLFSLRQYCSILVHTQQEMWAQDAWQILLDDTPVPNLDDLLREVLAAAKEEQEEEERLNIRASARRKEMALAGIPPGPIGSSLSGHPATNPCSPQQPNQHPQDIDNIPVLIPDAIEVCHALHKELK